MTIYVFGSMSMDLVTEAERSPKKGETILGTHFFMTTGGKGANQAVAAARLGAQVSMVGCIGDDEFGQTILKNLKDNNVSVNYVETIPQCSSGTASITLADNDNSIIVVPSANFKVSISQIDEVLSNIDEEDLVVLQNEIPVDVIEYTIKECHRKQITVIYNPAPYIEIDKSLLDLVTYFTPNETEVIDLFGRDYRDIICQYQCKMIVTVGKDGAVYYDDRLINIPAELHEVIDTTGAGDTFNGALAVALSEKQSLSEAICFANRAAGKSVTGLGAQGGMPYRKELV